MRPIRKGLSPLPKNYANYKDAMPDLVARLGPYCSYCERPVKHQLAVEHIQPKGLPAYSSLIGCWSNFLLACVNCNSTKRVKNVALAKVFLPDRDNTFAAFKYLPDGTIEPSCLTNVKGLQAMANDTLALMGLGKAAPSTLSQNGRQVALDRVSQRKEVWFVAEEAKKGLQSLQGNAACQDIVVELAKATGFLSVWMTVFAGNATMLGLLVDAFPGTRGSGCFNATGNNVIPAPNPDGLPDGGKL